MNQKHLTEEEVQLLGEAGARPAAGAHAAECPYCRARVQAARGIDRALRRLPLESAHPALAASVLQELGIVRGKRSRLWFVESIAAFAALCLVVGGLIAVFFLTGAVGGGDALKLPAAAEGVSQIQGAVSGAASSAMGWLTKSMQKVSGSSGVEMTLLMVGVVAALGILDRVLLRPLRHTARR